MDQRQGIVRFGVMGCSEFAARAMIPAMLEAGGISLVAVASRDKAKAEDYATRFGCLPLCGYEALLQREDIDAVYLPLPTGLHEEWGLACLDAGKHLLIEKSLASTKSGAGRIIHKARERKLLVVENFLFPYHSQYAWVRDRLQSRALGELALFRSTFSIPPLAAANIRYRRDLGGGALLDLGAYMAKACRLFLGDRLKLLGSSLAYDNDRGVDIRGAAMLQNERGQVAQVAFGLDSHYQCSWEFLGDKGRLLVERAYTPPPGFAPRVRLETATEKTEALLPPDNHCINMLRSFAQTTIGHQDFASHWSELEHQANLLHRFRDEATNYE